MGLAGCGNGLGGLEVGEEEGMKGGMVKGGSSSGLAAWGGGMGVSGRFGSGLAAGGIWVTSGGIWVDLGG